jgi:hypothetical protein
LPHFFRPGQRAIAHVEGKLLAAQLAGHRTPAVKNPGPPCRVVGERARHVADAGAQPAGRQHESCRVLVRLDLGKCQRMIG